MFQHLDRFVTGKDDTLLAAIRKVQLAANAATIVFLTSIALYSRQYTRLHAARPMPVPVIASSSGELFRQSIPDHRFEAGTAKLVSDKGCTSQRSATRRGNSYSELKHRVLGHSAR